MAYNANPGPVNQQGAGKASAANSVFSLNPGSLVSAARATGTTLFGIAGTLPGKRLFRLPNGNVVHFSDASVRGAKITGSAGSSVTVKAATTIIAIAQNPSNKYQFFTLQSDGSIQRVVASISNTFTITAMMANANTGPTYANDLGTFNTSRMIVDPYLSLLIILTTNGATRTVANLYTIGASAITFTAQDNATIAAANIQNVTAIQASRASGALLCDSFADPINRKAYYSSPAVSTTGSLIFGPMLARITWTASSIALTHYSFDFSSGSLLPTTSNITNPSIIRVGKGFVSAKFTNFSTSLAAYFQLVEPDTGTTPRHYEDTYTPSNSDAAELSPCTRALIRDSEWEVVVSPNKTNPAYLSGSQRCGNIDSSNGLGFLPATGNNAQDAIAHDDGKGYYLLNFNESVYSVREV